MGQCPLVFAHAAALTLNIVCLASLSPWFTRLVQQEGTSCQADLFAPSTPTPYQSATHTTRVHTLVHIICLHAFLATHHFRRQFERHTAGGLHVVPDASDLHGGHWDPRRVLPGDGTTPACTMQATALDTCHQGTMYDLPGRICIERPSWSLVIENGEDGV